MHRIGLQLQVGEEGILRYKNFQRQKSKLYMQHHGSESALGKHRLGFGSVCMHLVKCFTRVWSNYLCNFIFTFLTNISNSLDYKPILNEI